MPLSGSTDKQNKGRHSAWLIPLEAVEEDPAHMKLARKLLVLSPQAHKNFCPLLPTAIVFVSHGFELVQILVHEELRPRKRNHPARKLFFCVGEVLNPYPPSSKKEIALPLHQRGFPRTSSIVPRDQTGELNGQMAVQPTSHIANSAAVCHKPTPIALL